MQYRTNPKNEDRLSVLGYGCMRFTKRAGRIDQNKAEKELAYALKRGVNYFDTAYTYPGSEAALGKFIAKNDRDKLYIATKLPHYLIKKPEDTERFFQQQLSRLQTRYVDYYLIHMLGDISTWKRLCRIGIPEWIERKKNEGAIRNIGFSYHGATAQFTELLDIYDWDFCQIQYNYLDEHSQAGRSGLDYAVKKALAVMIMEPLRGGRLAERLVPAAKKIFEQSGTGLSPAAWGLKWIWEHPGVTLILSGMNDIEQIKQNADTAGSEDYAALPIDAQKIFENVKKEIYRTTKVECTGCAYCMPCPHGVNIADCFKAFNDRYAFGLFIGQKEYIMCTTLNGKNGAASNCTDCGLCETKCPQHIAIRKELKSVKAAMENPVYKIIKFFSNRIAKF